jgi:hypothetical protein
LSTEHVLDAGSNLAELSRRMLKREKRRCSP